jgi:hypothetical protein
LNEQNPLRAEIMDFARGATAAAMSADGKYVVADGRPATDRRAIRVFDASGRMIWDIPTTRSDPNTIRITPTGHVISSFLDDEHRAWLLDLDQRRSIGRWIAPPPQCLGPNASRWIVATVPELHKRGVAAYERGISLFNEDRVEPLVTLGIDDRIGDQSVQFDPTGRFVVWGDNRGTLRLCDIPEVDRQLSAAGLGW